MRPYLVFFLLCAGGFVYAYDTLDFIQNIDNSQVNVRISGIDEAGLWSHIVQGFRARVQYTLRIYQDMERSSLLGDRLLLEMDLVQEGRWDVFGSCWEIRHANGRRVFYQDWDEFYKNFRELNFPLMVFSGEEKLYMLARVRFQETVFRPPLNILQMFYSGSELQSDWRRFGVP